MYSIDKENDNIKKAKGVKKKCDRKGDNTRALQRSALWKERVHAQDEDFKERGPRDVWHVHEQKIDLTVRHKALDSRRRHTHAGVRPQTYKAGGS